jgi:prephenate dehydrogenase
MADAACEVAGTDAGLLGGCDVVVLCTPVDVMPQWLAEVARRAPTALVTDCGSTKAWLMARARELLGPGRFLGGHPMAGRERSGYEAADPSLFVGATWVLTPERDDDLAAFAPWIAAIRTFGARPLVTDAATHDEAVAWISHLPFALSAALVRAAGQAPVWPTAAALASSGYRDMSRLAGGEPAMYAAIVRTNRHAILAALEAYAAELARLRSLLEDPAADWAAWFAAARGQREAWLAERNASGGV